MIEPTHELQLWIYSRTAFDTRERAGKLVDYLMTHPRFAPDHFGEHVPLRRLTPENLDQAVSLLVNPARQELNSDRSWSMVFFKRTRRPRCSYLVHWSKLPHEGFAVSTYHIEEQYIRDPLHLSEWLEYARGLLELHNAWYAAFALSAEIHEKNFLHWYAQHPYALNPEQGVETARGVGVELHKGIPGVYWGNYFGPFYVDWFGREKFERLPCVEKHWLDKGGIFFVTAPTPFDWDTPDTRQLQEAVKQHLGVDAFFDINTVHQLLAELGPIPEHIEPEDLQPPRRVPEFPFKIESPRRGLPGQEVKETRRFFESRGFTFVGIEGGALIFHDEKGGVTRVTVGPGGQVEYWPK